MSLLRYSESEDSSDGESGGLVAYQASKDQPAVSDDIEEAPDAGGVVVLIKDETTAVPLEQPIAPEIAKLIDTNKIDLSLLPPWPTGSISKKVLAKFDKLRTYKIERGTDINAHIFGKKGFRNPSIYEKLINVMSLNETGTNFPKEVYDPSVWGKKDKCPALSAAQKEFERHRGKSRQQRTEIAFVAGQKEKKRKLPAAESMAQVEAVKRKIEALQQQMKSASAL